jgi:polysaccharide biosynthesis protein PslH
MATEHIAVLVPYTFVPPKSGGQKAAYGLCFHLSQVKQLTAISTQANKVEMAGFSILPLLGKTVLRYINPLTIIPLYRFFSKHKVSQVIAFQPFIVFLAYFPCKILGIRLSIYVQNIEYKRFKSIKKKYWPIVFMVEWITLRLADKLLFISPDEVEPGKRLFRLKADKCEVLPFGVSYSHAPDYTRSRSQIRQRNGYPEDLRLIIFFGPLGYQPNLEALERIIDHIEPALRKIVDFPYRFLICGGGLPKKFSGLSRASNIDYLGFVEDIEALVQACDLMVNPVNTGGGVKTKVIESIGLGVTVVSSSSGALGVDPMVCGEKLIRVQDQDYPAFAQAIAANLKIKRANTPESFYQTYYWGNIVKKI